MFPLGDGLPEPPNDKVGWWAAGVVAVLGGLGTFWNTLRKSKGEDSTTALTHANTIIKGYERIVSRQDIRQRGLEDEMARRDAQWWKEIDALRECMEEYTRKEQQCQMRLEWLCGHLRSQNIEFPDWPFIEDTGGRAGEASDGRT